MLAPPPPGRGDLLDEQVAEGSDTWSALVVTSDIHQQVPTNMSDIRRDWLTNQNADCCFVVIGSSTRQSHSPLLYS